MTQVWRKTIFGSDAVSNAEQLDMNFQIGVFTNFPENSISIQATCSIGGDLIHVFSSESEDIVNLSLWLQNTMEREIAVNQKALDNASTV